MIIDLTQPTSIGLDHVGGKAFNLHKLALLGLPVPAAMVIPVDISLTSSSDKEKFISIMNDHPVIRSGSSFAVRSSGVGEDGEGHSFAGIFDTFLDVPVDKVYESILKVRSSIDSARSAMYAEGRSVAIESMGVVVQHMVNADYAGVAFSVSPIEKDDRIALIEVVEGNGDSLVSGEKTPATIRVNKLMNTVRIQQHGADRISEDMLERLCEMILPLLVKIERAYGIGVDVEWAVADGTPYILQARPITT